MTTLDVLILAVVIVGLFSFAIRRMLEAAPRPRRPLPPPEPKNGSGGLRGPGGPVL